MSRDGRLDIKTRNHLGRMLDYLLMLNHDPFFFDWYRRRLIRHLQTHRRQLKTLIQACPELRHSISRKITEVYPEARLFASKGIGRRMEVLPTDCPYSFKKIIDHRFIPESEHIPLEPYQAKSGAEIWADWEESGFHVSDIVQRQSGLPMIIWAVEKIISKNICAIAVNRYHHSFKKARIMDAVLVSVLPKPRVLFGGELAERDLRIVQRFIRQNADAIRRHWRGDTSTAGLYDELLRLGALPERMLPLLERHLESRRLPVSKRETHRNAYEIRADHPRDS